MFKKKLQMAAAFCSLALGCYAAEAAVAPASLHDLTGFLAQASGPNQAAATDSPEKDNATAKTAAKLPETTPTAGEGYYRAPMDIRLLPSANFAETRPGHLHSGIDIRTGGVEGQPVYSAADGHIARIGIAPWGYGRVLYIAHPNGTTTVYAHMQKFIPEVERYVDGERYRLKIHNVDLYPDAAKFPVKRGQLIGYSGNSGSSGGPHLHFEVRETASQRPVNVLARGYLDIKDDIPPRIVNLYYIEIDTVGVVPVYSRPRLIGVANTAPGKYTLSGTDTVAVGRSGYFVIEVTDRKNDTNYTMGIYSIELNVDGRSVFSYALDGFSFDQKRYVNSLMQYDMQVGQRNQFLRLARQENNKLPVFGRVSRGGLIMPSDDSAHPVVITVSDDSGNVSTLSFNVRRRAADTQFYTANDVEGIMVDCRKNFVWSRPGVEVNIPANALYESIFYRQSSTDTLPAGRGNTRSIPRFSPVYDIHDKNVPVHTSIVLSITPENVPENILSKLCFAMVSESGDRYNSAGGKYDNGRVTASLRNFGRYCVVADTVPPVIRPSFTNGADLRGVKSIYFITTDNFAGVASYTATIDGRWIAFEQGKAGRITHVFDPSRIEYKGVRHELVITVTDGVGNSKTLKREFIK